MFYRLDRLFLLIENGGSLATRRVAAEQLSDVVANHTYQDEQTQMLLKRLIPFLSEKNWDTRIASSDAIGSIIQALSYETSSLPEKSSVVSEKEITTGVHILFKVLKDSISLTAGIEDLYSTSDANSSQAIEKQRFLLNKQLGLDVSAALGVDMSGLFSDEDLIITNQPNEEDTHTKLEDSDDLKGKSKGKFVDDAKLKRIKLDNDDSSNESTKTKV